MSRNEIDRAYLTGKFILWISFAGHFGQIFIWVPLDRPVLSWLNVGSVLLLGSALYLLLRRRITLPWLLFLLELIVNNCVTTWILGIGGGFIIYPLVGAAVMVSIPFAQPPVRLGAFAVTLAVTLGLVSYVFVTGPVAPVSGPITTIALLANLLNTTLAIAIVLWFYAREIWRTEAALEREYDRSEGLLRNIMPAAIAQRLKQGEKTIADDHPIVSVLFADIVDFTAQASSMAPNEVIALLDRVFNRFDSLADSYGVEKIKTIGDAYMAVAGLPTFREDHAEALANLARDIVTACAEIEAAQGRPFKIRVGIHSGPVVAGVIGARKIAFDLWGDVVNTASRLESTSEPGRIQVSAATRDLLKDKFPLSFRGPVDLKGKGIVDTWYLDA